MRRDYVLTLISRWPTFPSTVNLCKINCVIFSDTHYSFGPPIVAQSIACWGVVHSHSLLLFPIVGLSGSTPLLAQQGDDTKQISNSWNTIPFQRWKVLTFPFKSWCKFSRLWRNIEKHMYFGGDSRPPAISETFLVGYFHSCDWLSGFSETTYSNKKLTIYIRTLLHKQQFSEIETCPLPSRMILYRKEFSPHRWRAKLASSRKTVSQSKLYARSTWMFLIGRFFRLCNSL